MSVQPNIVPSYRDVYWNEVAFNGVLKSSKNKVVTYQEQTVLYAYSETATPIGKASLPFEIKQEDSNFGAFTFFLIIAVMWSWFYQTNFKTVVEINKAQFNFKAFQNQVSESSGGNTVVLVGLLISAMALISYGVAECFAYFKWFEIDLFASGSVSPVIVFVGLLGLIFAKVLILFFSSVITNDSYTFNQYFALNIVSLQFVGAVLFPLMVLYRFAPVFNAQVILYAVVVIIAIMFAYRLLRMFVIALNQRSADFLHIILYICALEIMPILLLWKWQLN